MILYLLSTTSGQAAKTWPFDKRSHLILNIAVGGEWGGAQGIDTSAFPQKMTVDYVHVAITSVKRARSLFHSK